ncbi:septal ring lytic transglycosylase RlpA family protein [Flavobacterium sp. RHBU_3]|uniref:septal ring lytic transglycosylase RlpA family protein n=1 Tax=Flavobacterium sp. RHBU_3 TaxID=3391184 RepID=UPI0039847AEB
MRNSIIIFSTAVLLFILTAFTAVPETVPAKVSTTAKSPDTTEVASACEEVKETSDNLTLYKTSVLATYYANKFNGRKTTSGERFHNSKYTAAHMRLPFGTMVRVTNESNGKSVDVKVNDRGPYSKKYEIDLTRQAFMEIASKKGSGSFKVKIEIIGKK